MAVRDDRINSQSAQKAAEWVITTMRSWFWQNKKNRRSKQWNDKMVRFITVRWTEGDFDPFEMETNTEDPSIPNFPQWDQDTINLCELLCVAMKTFYEKKEGGLLLWLLDEIAIAAKEWNIASGDEEFANIIRMISWIERFFINRENINLTQEVKKIKESVIIALSRCEPNLSHPLTLSAYSSIISDVSPLLKNFKHTKIMNDLEEKFRKIKLYASEIPEKNFELNKIIKFLRERKFDPITEENPGWIGYVRRGSEMVRNSLGLSNPQEEFLKSAKAAGAHP
ncbi:MAG: hypothetical protein HQL84_18705 [Magnetococcales bacterium]|nr:hypothetical protein [Magnetococcales bacterium]MBF0152052.1 hypothetical protein [Magnetococcales bacterium]